MQSTHVYQFLTQMFLISNDNTSLGVGMNAVPGGAFPIPSACAHVLAKLPPPRCFQVSVTRHALQ